MKRITLFGLTMLAALTMVSKVPGQETKGAAPEKPAVTVEKVSPGTDKPGLPQESAVVRVKVRRTSRFIGTVIEVNYPGKTITLRNRGILVTFDAGNPTLQGYKSLREIKVGHTVAISYTTTGISIEKGSGKPSRMQEEAAKSRCQTPLLKEQIAKPKRETPAAGKDLARLKKGALVRVAQHERSTSFDDVDENKDSKVNAVELSTIIPNLTIRQFRQYDKNGDGCLNRSEFKTLKAP